MTSNYELQHSILTENINKLENKLKLTDNINMNRNMKNDLNKQLNNFMEKCTEY